MLGRSGSCHKCIMGNCIGTRISSSEKEITSQSLEGRKEEFEVSETAEKIISGSYEVANSSSSRKALVPDAKLTLGEVYCLIPEPVEHWGSPPSQKTAEDSYRGRRVKIVVSKQQLEQLVRSIKELQCSRTSAIQSSRTREPCQKWRPSLATIPEL